MSESLEARIAALERTQREHDAAFIDLAKAIADDRTAFANLLTVLRRSTHGRNALLNELAAVIEATVAAQSNTVEAPDSGPITVVHERPSLKLVQ